MVQSISLWDLMFCPVLFTPFLRAAYCCDVSGCLLPVAPFWGTTPCCFLVAPATWGSFSLILGTPCVFWSHPKWVQLFCNFLLCSCSLMQWFARDLLFCFIYAFLSTTCCLPLFGFKSFTTSVATTTTIPLQLRL